MASIVLEQEVIHRLEASRRRVDVLDEQGCLHGFFVPVGEADDQASDSPTQNQFTLPPGVIVPFDSAETQRALDERGGRTLNEIMAELRAMP